MRRKLHRKRLREASGTTWARHVWQVAVHRTATYGALGGTRTPNLLIRRTRLGHPWCLWNPEQSMGFYEMNLSYSIQSMVSMAY